MSRLSLCVAVLLASLSHAAAPPLPAQVRFDIRILSGDPFGPAELLCRPTVVALDGQAATVGIGQAAGVGGKDDDPGYTLTLVPTVLPGGKVRVELSAKVTTRLSETETETRLRTEKVAAVRTLAKGIVQRVRVGGSGETTSWVEIVYVDPGAPEASIDRVWQDVAKPAHPAR